MNQGVAVQAPLFRDPIYDGATDPVIIWNQEEECWWMLYTQRRSTELSIGVSHIHGTKIGVASSKDGGNWLYRGTLLGLEFEHGHNTFWAPEVIFANGKYHMYVSYVRGIPSNWNYERHIVHYTATDLWEWQFESILELSSNRVIDACVYQIEEGGYKMWYKDEGHGSHTYSAYSDDLYHWEVLGEEISDVPHEGPNVFELGGRKWMITDYWNGLAVYHSEDFTHWVRSEDLLGEGGSRTDDGVMANHADVVVVNDEAYIFYFVHPEFPREMRRGHKMTYKEARTVIQVAHLRVEDGKLCCDRDEVFELKM